MKGWCEVKGGECWTKGPIGPDKRADGVGMRSIPERAKKFRVRALGREFEASAQQGRHPAVDERASDDEPAEQDQRQQQRLGPGLANGADVRGQAAQVSLQSGPDGDKLRIVAIKA